MKRLLGFILIALLLTIMVLPAIGQTDARFRDAFILRKLEGRGGIPLYWDGFIYGQYAGTTRDCIFYNYTGSGQYLMRLQGDGVNVLTIDKSGNIVTSGTLSPSLASGNIIVGNAANVGTSVEMTGDVTITNAGVATVVMTDFIPVADFSPTGDETENVVTTTRSADGTNRRMLNRTTGISDTQDMDWYSEKAVTKTPTSLTIWTRASDFANCVMTIQVWDFSGNADATGAVAITPTGNDTWEEFTYTFTSTYTNDEELWIKIAITSLDTADTIDFGRAKINY